jgi:exopolysaccharide biosynthesis polyprenyl glycosylphosphotransferase
MSSTSVVFGETNVELTAAPATAERRVCNSVAKRAIDIVGSLVLLVLLSPPLLLIAIVIRLTSPGPVFFRQERLGLYGRTFTIYKFRSMVVDAEAETGPVFATAEDRRRTMVGSVLRRLSLDELPQLYNILRGHMSLVGPRPERPYFVALFQRDIPGYVDRLRVRPGVTGWAQVNGLRGNTSILERTRHDLDYIENWSFAFDIRIMFVTAVSLVSHRHAY